MSLQDEIKAIVDDSTKPYEVKLKDIVCDGTCILFYTDKVLCH
jgi:hypothetical protein